MSALQSRFSLLLLVLAAACGGGSDAKPQETPAPAPTPAVDAPASTGKVIEVKMVTNGADNYYEPKSVEAAPGDVVRFVLEVGVHNVHFVTDSNPGVSGLPEASEMFQLPGQTWDFVVPAASGKSLFYQCDPHAALGMVGHIIVK